jgi:hypothetical protein
MSSVSDVQIARLALQHIGDRYDINSLDEASPEAEQVSLVYDNVRDATQREHPWTFCTSYYNPPALSGTVPANWQYMYAYPPDGLKVWRIVNPLGRNLPALPFRVFLNADDIKVIGCNEESPEIEYAKRITSASRFDANFVLAFSWRLAAMIARPITGDPEIARSVRVEADIQVNLAKREDANEGVEPEVLRDPDWIRGRA